MQIHEHKLRVRYAETDQMGVVYYANYLQYLEVARVEMLRQLGFPYAELEESGLLLPVIDVSVRYHTPAGYDQVLTIATSINTYTGARIGFDYSITNEQGESVCKAVTTLVFVDKETRKPRRAPADLHERIQQLVQTSE